MKHRWIHRLLSIVIVLALLMQMMPPTVFAAEKKTSAVEVSEQPTPAEIVGENETLRTATEKHFELTDGSSIAVMYGMPVHYQDEDGDWQDIDNSLTLITANDGTAVYRTANAVSPAAFSTSLADGQLVATGNGDTAVAMFLLDTTLSNHISTEDGPLNTFGGISNADDTVIEFNRNAVATVVADTNANTRSATVTTEGWSEEDVQPENLSSSILYEDVFPGVDLLYTAYSYHIKEEIIVNTPQTSYQYDFLLQLNGLTAQMNEDGSVSLLNEENEEAYYIPAPFMIDANGEVSDAVTYTLTATQGGFVLTVTADAEWINAEGRAFPVSIDPTLQDTMQSGKAERTSPFFCNYIAEGEAGYVRGISQWVYQGWMAAKSSKSGKTMGNLRTHAFFNILPDVPAGSIITDASFHAAYINYTGSNFMDIAAFEATSPCPSGYSYWGWFYNMTWNSKPSFNSNEVLDYVHVSASIVDEYVSWDLTEVVKKWYREGTENRSIVFTRIDNGTNKSYAYFKGYGSVSAYPMFIVSYRSVVGIEPYYTYATLGAGHAGTAYISDATGQLKIAKGIASYASSVNPFSLNLVYTSDYFNAKLYDDSGVLQAQTDYQPPTGMGLSMQLGSGWSLDAIQKMEDEIISDVTWLKYTDGDGTNHWFYPGDDGKYYDEDGLGLKVTVGSTSSDNYTMTDDKDNVWTFTGGYLTSMADASGNKILINYSSGKLNTIQQQNNGQSAITVASFAYSGNYVSTITDAAGNVYTLGYTDGELTSVKLGATTIATYGYNGYCVTSMTDNESSYSLNFTYDTAKLYYTGYSEKGSSTTGAQVSISYPNYSTTVYRDYGNDRTANTSDDIITSYLFDYAGRTANAYTTDNSGNILGASNSVYSAYEGVDKTNNRTLRSASIGIAAQQLVRNSGFESTSNDWTYSNSSRVTDKPRTGSYSMRGTGASSATHASESLASGTTYTLSGYINTSAWTANGGNVYLKVTAPSGATYSSEGVNYTTSDSLDGGWVRISITFTAESGAHTIGVYSSGVSGYFYADDIQLQLGDAPSNHNLLENGNMNISSYGWTLGTGAAYTASSGKDGSQTIMITGVSSDATTNAYQDVAINLPGNNTFVLSGWVKANAVADHSPTDATDLTKKCGLRAIITYSNGDTENHYASFNADLTDWQFTTLTIVPQNPTGTVTSIRVVCAYEQNANTAYFDNISLTREVAQTMEYDADGNLVSVTSPNLNEDTNTYSSGNLVKTVTGGNGTYEYTYDSAHRLTKVTVSGVNLSQSMAYDTVGNVTSTTLAGSSGANIQTSATYTNAGNLVASVTDGNGNTTAYGYSSNLNKMYGLPSGVTNAKGTVTASTYDAYGRVTGNSIASTASLGYTYSGGNLSQVTRTNNASVAQTYNFTYDVFGNMTNLKVGSQQLAAYTYGTGNGQLSKQTYGNGDTVTFTYDDLGRVKTAVYSDGKSLTYQYNGEGLLHSITEVVDGTTSVYYYTYDTLGRLINSRKKTGSTTVLLTNQTYNANNQLTGQNWQMGDTVYSQSFTYNSSDGSLATMATGTGKTLTMGYDALRRLSTVNSGVYTRTYNYHNISDSRTTTQVSSLVYSGNVSQTYSYTYDALGNILTYTAPGKAAFTYTYDNQGQLTKATNGTTTYNYSYDTVGNITAANGHSYTYGNSNWRDLLTAYDGQSISYDGSGNPTSYYNGTRWTFTWKNGRELATASNGTASISYAYDLSGLRTVKNVGGTVHNYIYASGKLLRETYGSNTLDFFYDNNGTPFALKHNGTLYYYVTNLQGDVMNLVDGSGNVVATYDYDPYGKVITSTGSMAEINPLRYRGYYYDTESGLYYLQSRYYDPSIGRFINADEFASSGQGVVGHNMFAYCGNSPITRADSSGNTWETIFDILSLGASIIEVAVNPTDPMAWLGLVGDTIDLIPVVTGVGEAVRTYKIASRTAEAAQEAATVTIKITKASDFTDDAKKIVNSLERVDGVTKSQRNLGVSIHQGYKVGEEFLDTAKEYNKISGIRPDYADTTAKVIYELKPCNKNAIKSGIKQLLKYNDTLGGGYTLWLEVY